jgi:hypothetical protein
MANICVNDARLSAVTLTLWLEGEAWGGFTAEQERSATFAPGKWPGMRKAVAALLDWGDCVPGTVRAYYGQLEHRLVNPRGWQVNLVRELEGARLERIQP